MAKPKLYKRESKLIAELVAEYEREKILIDSFLQAVLSDMQNTDTLGPLVHSYRFRLKDPTHLADKLERKIIKCKENDSAFNVTSDNLFEEINDLAGIRILHLYTAQISELDPILRELFCQKNYELIEGPFARTWDNESKAFFNENNIDTEESETLYTSVHYVIASNTRRRMTCEIQVRTLSEEVWGEVDHKLNYPHKTDSLPCSEQLKVLARVTSSVSRLVDSIFRTYEDSQN
ncbi:MAG: (p)ppGpp synthetase [Gammaproteobacteria bacterium]